MKQILVYGRIFNVSNYGGYPNDNLDDTNATQAAAYLASSSGPNNIVVFQSGRYDFQSTVSLYNAINLTVMGQGQDVTFLIGHSPTMMFNAGNSVGLTLMMFSIDYQPLSFTAGYVVSVAASYLDLQVVAPHQADVGRQVAAI
ncbi:unnamed protein product, partial [Rotaria magnacalcarata]